MRLACASICAPTCASICARVKADAAAAKSVSRIRLRAASLASITPDKLAMVDAIDAGRVQHGDLLLLVGFGAGMTSAAAVIRWDPPAR